MTETPEGKAEVQEARAVHDVAAGLPRGQALEDLEQTSEANYRATVGGGRPVCRAGRAGGRGMTTTYGAPRLPASSGTSHAGVRNPRTQEPRSRDCDAGRGRRGCDLLAASEFGHPCATSEDRP